MVNKNYTTTLSCFTLFFCKLHSISTWFKDLRGLSVWMGMSLMIGTSPSWNAWVFFLTLNVVHPWITMLHSPQCLFQLFFIYNLTSRLQELPPSLFCQHVHFYIWPTHLCSRQRGVLDVQVSIDFQDWEKTQQLYRSPSPPLWLPSRLHTSLQHYPLFIPFLCVTYRFPSA